jgi:hypothetical protein
MEITGNAYNSGALYREKVLPSTQIFLLLTMKVTMNLSVAPRFYELKPTLQHHTAQFTEVPGSILGATRLSEKWWVWNRVHSTS